MRKFIISICILAVLMLPCMMLVSAQSISITPTFFDVSGDIGAWTTKSVIIHNGEEFDVGVTVTSNLEGSMIPDPAIIVPAHSDRTMNIMFVIKRSETGWLTYTSGGEQFNQLVTIKANKVNVSVMMFPSSPMPGDTVSFLITDELIQDAKGYLVCSKTGRSYLINIVDGLGTVSLNKSDSGAAFYYISTAGMTPVSKQFIIGQADGTGNNTPANITDTLTIEGQSTVAFNSRHDYIVYLNSRLQTYQSVKITNPDGSSTTGNTGYFGSVNVQFDVPGTWELFTLTPSGLIGKKNVVCQKEQKTLSVLTKDPHTDAEVQIGGVFPDAAFSVSGPEGNEEITVLTDYAVFTPMIGGTYIVTAESDTATAKPLTVNVKTSLSFGFFDPGRSGLVSTVQANKGYYIQLIGENGSAVDMTDKTVTVTNAETNTKSTVTMSANGGYWKPTETGSYSFSFKGDSQYIKTDDSLMISSGIIIPKSSSGIDLWLVGGIIFFLVAIVLVVRYRKFIPILNRAYKKGEGDTGRIVPPE